MSDITYGVNVEYISSGNLELPSSVKELEKNFGKNLLSGISGAANKFNGVFDSIAGSLLSAGVTAAEGIGAALAAGMALAVREAIKFNQEMEDTQVSLGTIASMQGTGENNGFANQFRFADVMIKQMRRDAKELPGAFHDLQNIMGLIAPSALNAGMGQAGTEAFAAKTMAAAAVMRVNFTTAGREMGAMISGNATGRMPMFSKLGLGEAKDFNKLSEQQRISKINEKFEKMGPGIEAFKHNWSTVSSNFVDNIKIGVGMVGGPLLNHVKEAMEKFNKDGPSQRWIDIGAKLGDWLVTAFDYIKHGIEEWGPHVENFVKTMYNGMKSIFGEGSFLRTALDHLKSFMDNPDAFKEIKEVGKVLLAVRVGGAAIGAAGPVAEGAGALGLGLGASLSVFAVLAAAIVGVVDVLTDTRNQFYEFAHVVLRDIKVNAKDLGISLLALWIAVKPLVDLLGVTLLVALDVVIAALGLFVKALAIPAKGISDLLNDDAGDARRSDKDWADGLIIEMGDKIRDAIFQGFLDVRMNESRVKQNAEDIADLSIKAMNATAEREKAASPPTHTTHIHKVEIKVNSNQDPNRIAKAVNGILRSRALANTPAGQWAGNRDGN